VQSWVTKQNKVSDTFCQVSSEGVEESCWYVRKRKSISKRLKKQLKKFTSARLTFVLSRWRRVAVTFQPAEKKQKRLSGDEFFA
jgi:hypothetical protein